MNKPSFAPGARGIALMLALGLLAACGSKDSTSTSARTQASSASKPAKKTEATAEEVAEEKRGKVKCPAKVKTPARAAKAPVDDIVGVRPGVTYDEARNLVLCTHDLIVVTDDDRGRFRLNTYGQKVRQGFSAAFAEARVHKTAREWTEELQYGSRNRNKESTPGSRWYVGTMGVPGEERVVHATREETYEEGKQPTVQGVVDALLKKYGKPTRQHHDQRTGSVSIHWGYDPFGRLITETSPLIHSCKSVAGFGAAMFFSPDCGLQVAASIVPVRDNHAITKTLTVLVVDQAGTYEALQKTEQALAQMDAERRQREVDAAGKNANAPTL